MAIEIINGRQIGVSRMGEGAPLLLLHCALAHRGALAPLMSHLGAMSFTAIDLPGHGQSEHDQSTDLQVQAIETTIALLEEADGPSHLFGHSFGATVALRVAMDRPDLVRSVALYEPVYFSLLAHSNPQAYETEESAASAFSAAAEQGDWPNASRAFLSRWSSESFDDLSKAQQGYILRTIPLILASEPSISSSESGDEVLSQLQGLRLPLVLLEGRNSPPVISAINAVIAERTLSVERRIIDGASHMGPISHPGKVAAVLKEFFIE